MLATLTLLAGCTSVPLPPWTPVLPRPEAQAPAAPAMRTAPPPVANTAPVTQPTVIANAPQPYDQAVADRFPAPSVIYDTPGLQAGRRSLTTQAEIQAWLREQAVAASRSAGVAANVRPIGRSQRGQSLEALVLTRAADTEPATLLADGKPTVLLLAQQHGDEPAGSEALLVIAKELSQGLLQPLLAQVNVVLVPRANPDGAAIGQHATANGLDMGHDHLLLNTPEAQALAGLTRDYRPTVVVDAQEYAAIGPYLQKFGLIQKYDALLQYGSTANLPEFLTKAAEEWYRRPLLTALKDQGLSTEWYYSTSTNLADKKVAMGGTQPDIRRNVDSLKNVVSLLIATRGAGIGHLHLQRRVHTQVAAITSVLSSTALRARELGQLRPYLDKEVSALACKGEAVVEAGLTAAQHDLVMLDPGSGADRTITVDWDSSLALRKLKTRPRPCGYWLSAESVKAVERLRLHGIQVLRVAEPGALLGDSYREIPLSEGARQDTGGPAVDAGPVRMVQVSLVRGVVDVARGSYYVPLSQPLGNLVLAALEPDTRSSYFANRLLDRLDSTVRVMAEPSLPLDELP